MLYIIDSYAWVEYFIGSKKGEVLKKLFLDEKNYFILKHLHFHEKLN